MNVLAIADIHGVRETYAWLARVARTRKPDAVIIAGDLLGGAVQAPTMKEAHEIEAEAIVEMLSQIPCPVLYLMGNDDMAELPRGSENLIPIHGRRWELEGVSFVGYHYSLPFVGGIFEKPEREIKEDLERLAGLVDETTVLVTHSPAYGILDVVNVDRHAGSKSILGLISERRPRAHIHGHIHQAAGRKGNRWNVAAAGHRRAVLINLATLEDEVITDGC